MLLGGHLGPEPATGTRVKGLRVAADDLEDYLDGLLRAFLDTREEDEPFLADSRRMAEAIPGAELAVVAGGGHSPQFEAHDGWWAALTGFLR